MEILKRWRGWRYSDAGGDGDTQRVEGMASARKEVNAVPTPSYCTADLNTRNTTTGVFKPRTGIVLSYEDNNPVILLGIFVKVRVPTSLIIHFGTKEYVALKLCLEVLKWRIVV
ncbi:hypothetical protein CHS0354_037870 [Potamilus streckersoni]|uniref:Uncharacterized protein n=1 Tax=Potamilus streckersoni TaxID=2493646 RepID=A0AAE0T982_9BIVA|nr:hypothetical protein CHS0354_037870 [Potamilus streckersoni]